MPPSPPGRSNTALIVVIAVVVLGAVGAGAFFLMSGSDDGDRQAYVDVLVATADEQTQEDFPGLEIECAAGAMVDAIGVDNMALTPEEIEADQDYDFVELAEGGLNAEQAGGIYDGFADCGVDWRQLLSDQLTGASGYTESQVQCIDEAIDDQLLESLFVSEFLEDEAASAEVEAQINEATASCGSA